MWLKKFPATADRQALGKIAKFGDKKLKSTVLKNGACPKDVHHGAVLARWSEKARGRGVGAYSSVLACLDQQYQLSLPKPTKSETGGTATFYTLSRGLWCRLVFESHTIFPVKNLIYW